MRHLLVSLLLVTAACATDEEPATDTDIPDDTDLPIDTDAVDTDLPVDTDDSDAPADTDDTDAPLVDTDGGDTWYHVVLELRALGTGVGFDLDGDGSVDNAIGGLAGTLNPLLADNYGSTHQYAVTQLWGVDTVDQLVDVGILGGADDDEDPSDNRSGVEPFTLIGPSLSADGHAPLYASTSVDPTTGAYEATLPAGTLRLGVLQVPVATPIYIRGEITAANHTGALGGAVRTDDLVVVLDAFGLGSLAALASLLADIDLDADGEPDAVSVAFGFDGPAAVLVP